MKKKVGGVKRRISGCMLLSLGLLNYLLSLKAGFLLDPYNTLILLTGGLLFLSGLWAGRGRRADRSRG